MHDSGERQSFDSGAVRDANTGKPRPDLISPHAQLREGEWMRQGAEKYDERNWEKGIPISRCIASLERHLNAYKLGQTDEDHMAAIRTNASFIIHYEEEIAAGRMDAGIDDMPKYVQQRFKPVFRGIEMEYIPALDNDIVMVGGPVPAADVMDPGVEMAHGIRSRARRDERRCVYIAGPMRGYEAYNFPAFDKATDTCRAMGWSVLSPAEIERENGLDPVRRTEEAENRVMNWTEADWRAVVVRDLACIMSLTAERDAVVALPGWEKSTGAVAEIMVARWCGLPILDGSVETMPPLRDFRGTDFLASIRQFLQSVSG